MSANDNVKYTPLIAMKNRAARLIRLIDLDAPDIILESEINLILQSRDQWRTQNGHDWQQFEQDRKKSETEPLTQDDAKWLVDTLRDDGMTFEEIRDGLISEGLPEDQADEVLK